MAERDLRKEPMTIDAHGRLVNLVGERISVERLHTVGARRHGALWFRANHIVVDIFGGSKTMPSYSREGKVFLPLAVLRILDGIRVSSGETWNESAGKWESAHAAD